MHRDINKPSNGNLQGGYRPGHWNHAFVADWYNCLLASKLLSRFLSSKCCCQIYVRMNPTKPFGRVDLQPWLIPSQVKVIQQAYGSTSSTGLSCQVVSHLRWLIWQPAASCCSHCNTGLCTLDTWWVTTLWIVSTLRLLSMVQIKTDVFWYDSKMIVLKDVWSCSYLGPSYPHEQLTVVNPVHLSAVANGISHDDVQNPSNVTWVACTALSVSISCLEIAVPTRCHNFIIHYAGGKHTRTPSQAIKTGMFLSY